MLATVALWVLLTALAGTSGGCGVKVVTVPEGRALRLAADVKAPVYVEVSKDVWAKSDGPVLLHQGSYVIYRREPATQSAKPPAPKP